VKNVVIREFGQEDGKGSQVGPPSGVDDSDVLKRAVYGSYRFFVDFRAR